MASPRGQTCHHALRRARYGCEVGQGLTANLLVASRLSCHVFYSNEPADSMCMLHLIHLNIKHPVYLLSWF